MGVFTAESVLAPTIFKWVFCFSSVDRVPFLDVSTTLGLVTGFNQWKISGITPRWIPLRCFESSTQHGPGSVADGPYSNTSPVDFLVMERTGTSMAAVPTARISLKNGSSA